VDTKAHPGISDLVSHAIDDLGKARDELKCLPDEGGASKRPAVETLAREIDDIRGRLGSIS
jgi:hypothetical protein